MHDILNKLDNLDEAAEQFKLKNSTAADIREEKIEQEFLTKIESALKDDSIAELRGKFNDISTEPGGRAVNFVEFINECEKLTKQGVFKDGDLLYMKPAHAKNLKQEASKMFKYIEDVELKSAYDSTSATDMQAYLNQRGIGSRGENKESTMQGIKNKIHKINLLEAIARGEAINYSSNIKTPEEQEDFKMLKKAKLKEDNRSKAMSNDDYNKIYNPIMDKLINCPEKATEAEVAFVLAGEFGLRPSSILKIDISKVDVKKGTIEVEIEDNKSKQMFLAKTSYEDSDNMITQQTLSAVYKRALLLHQPDEEDKIKLVDCCDQNLHQEFSKICKRYGVNQTKYSGKYKTLRHRYAQNIYDEVRQIVNNEDITLNAKKTKALAEVNYLLGHEHKKINTTMTYVRNIW